MARKGITREQVLDTIQTLVEQGSVPTQISVRKQLGNTGSFSIIGKISLFL